MVDKEHCVGKLASASDHDIVAFDVWCNVYNSASKQDSSWYC